VNAPDNPVLLGASPALKAPRILIVDDTPFNLQVLEGILADGYRVQLAESGPAALQAAAAEPVPDLVLLDVNMPGMDGFEVCRRLKVGARTHAIPVIFVTALTDPEEERRGFEAGGVDFIVKPVRPQIVRARVQTHLALANENLELERKVRERTADLKTAFLRTVELAMNLSQMRDPYTAGHERRVAVIAEAIGAELGFDLHRQEGLRVASSLHDIGKITIPAEILAKPRQLSAAEFALVKDHPMAGYTALKDIVLPWPVAECALQHHERIDGSGYPAGLKGDEIVFEARILAVADVVEAMASHRPYRAGLGIAKALAEIERGLGTAYDPQAAGACLRLFREKNFELPSA
jgi:putative two-component system response regulator